jgi:CRISPR-associated protein Cmr1
MKTKYTTTFTCEIITPMFLNGAEAGNSPEIRTQSFKGGLRFWWRALQSDYSTYNALREAEVKLFGGSYDTASEEEKILRSPVKISILKQQPNLNTGLKNSEGLQWRFNPGSRSLTGPHRGIGYLQYSVAENKPYLEDGQTFLLELSTSDSTALKEAIVAFYAMSKFGSVGTRARRGAGSFHIVKISSDIELSLEELERRINVFNQNSSIRKHSSLCGAELVQSEERFDDWKSALNQIGEKFADFRTAHKGEIFKTPAFGIPVQHRNGPTLKIGSQGAMGINSDKRSSPLWIKVGKDDMGYYWQVLYLSGDFLPEASKIVAIGGNYTGRNSSDWDPSLVTKFMNQIKQGQQ